MRLCIYGAVVQGVRQSREEDTGLNLSRILCFFFWIRSCSGVYKSHQPKKKHNKEENNSIKVALLGKMYLIKE